MLRAHLGARGNEIIVPTERLIRHWCGRLNKELFSGQLPAPHGVALQTREDWMACAVFEYGDRTRWWLEFAVSPIPRKHFLEILAHELVHAAVYLIDKQPMTVMHGVQFMAYRSTLAKHGLPLKDAFYG